MSDVKAIAGRLRWYEAVGAQGRRMTDETFGGTARFVAEPL
jgi:hypothetical protein